MSNPIKVIAGQTVIYGLSSIIPRFLNYLLVPLHTGVFEISQYGVITDLYAYVTFLVIFLTYGMETGFFRFSQNNDKDKVYGTVFVSIIATSCLFIASVIVFADGLAVKMHYGENPEYIIWFAWILGLDAIAAIPFARFRLDGRPLRFAFFKIGNVAVNITVTLFFLWFCPKHADNVWIQKVYSVETGVGYVFIANLIASVATIVLLLPGMFRHKISFDFVLWKRIVRYSLPLMAAGIAGNVIEAFDRVLLKHRLTDAAPMEQVGIFGANVKIAVLMILFIQMFRYAAEPFFFNNAKEKDSRETIAAVMKYFIIFCLLIFLGVTFYIDIIKHIIRGEEYWAGLNVVPVMLLAYMCLGIYYNLTIWFKLTNQTNYGLIIASVGAAVSIAGNWLLIPVWGYHASAWTHLVCYIIMICITWHLGRRHYPIPYQLKRIALYVIIALSLYSLAYFTKIENFAQNIFKNTILFIIFALYINRNENLIKQILWK